MRKSLEDIASIVRQIPYPSPLPEELMPLHCYTADGGHCILCIPECFLDEARATDMMSYEVPLPVKYVLEKGWRAIPGCDSISVDVEYDNEYGAQVPEEYEEF